MIKMDTIETSLRKLYLDERLNMDEVALKMGWTHSKVANQLHKFKIRKHELGKIAHVNVPTLAYISGIFDGEGSLYILRRKRMGKEFLKIVFDIGMTHKETILTIFNILTESGFHPKFRPQKYKGIDKRGYDRTKWKTFYRISLYWMQEIKKILELLLPYLITKKYIAELGIQYVSQRKWGGIYTKDDFKILTKIIKLTERKESD